MKNQHLFPLCLGLVLAGCGRTETDSKKVSSTDTPNATPAANDQSQAAAVSPPATMAGAEATSDSSTNVPASSSMAAQAARSTSIAPSHPSADNSLAKVDPALSTATPSDLPDTVAAFKPASSDRIAEWKLSPADIRDELQTSGQIVRSRTAGAGEPTGSMDGILSSQINSKLHDDPGTTALAIGVETAKGVVTLTGTASSPEQLGNIIALTLDTGGVTQVISQIKLETAP